MKRQTQQYYPSCIKVVLLALTALTLCLTHSRTATTWCTTATPTSSGRPRQWETTSQWECTQTVGLLQARTVPYTIKAAVWSDKIRCLLTVTTRHCVVGMFAPLCHCPPPCLSSMITTFNGVVIYMLGYSNRTVWEKESWLQLEQEQTWT